MGGAGINEWFTVVEGKVLEREVGYDSLFVFEFYL